MASNTTLKLALLTAALALVAVPAASALSVGPVHVEVNTQGIPGGLWLVGCTHAFVQQTGALASIWVYQITHEDLLDATSYVSDTGWFAGNEVIAAGSYIDCATL